MCPSSAYIWMHNLTDHAWCMHCTENRYTILLSRSVIFGLSDSVQFVIFLVVVGWPGTDFENYMISYIQSVPHQSEIVNNVVVRTWPKVRKKFLKNTSKYLLRCKLIEIFLPSWNVLWTFPFLNLLLIDPKVLERKISQYRTSSKYIVTICQIFVQQLSFAYTIQTCLLSLWTVSGRRTFETFHSFLSCSIHVIFISPQRSSFNTTFSTFRNPSIRKFVTLQNFPSWMSKAVPLLRRLRFGQRCFRKSIY